MKKRRDYRAEEQRRKYLRAHPEESLRTKSRRRGPPETGAGTGEGSAPPAPDEFAGQLTLASKWADTDNIKRLVETFKDPAVQQYLATDPSVKNILLPIQ